MKNTNMAKWPVLLFLMLLLPLYTAAQTVTPDKGGKANPNIIPAIGWGGPEGNKALIFLQIDNHTKHIFLGNDFNSRAIVGLMNTNFVLLEGARQIRLITDIAPKKLSQYRYRILIDDSIEVVHWQQPAEQAIDSLDEKSIPSFLDIGKEDETLLAGLDVIGKKVTVQMYNINYPSSITTVYIYNKPIKKAKIWLATYLEQASLDDGKPGRAVGTIVFDTLKLHNKVSIGSFGDVNLWFKGDNDAIKLYQIYVENRSDKDKVRLSVPSRWLPLYKIHMSEKGYFSVIPKGYFDQPGTYRITVVPVLHTTSGELKLFHQKADSIQFTVLPAARTFSLTQVLIFLGILAAIAGLLFWRYKTVQSKRLLKSEHQSELAKSELNTVRLQLNPHFVFNALSGIQNLMNKQDTETANHYLGKFARLTRSVLDDSRKELITISDEIKLQEDYLQMEQLRFDFRYAIHVDEGIDANNTEVPSMLLQPFVENAVKYGIYQKRSEGRIAIAILKEKERLILQVVDNGDGFDTSKEYGGLGIKLSRSRIKLLNTIYNSAEIALDLQSDEAGTVVTIYLNHWI